MTRSILSLSLLAALACDGPRAPLDAGHDAGAPIFGDVQYAVRCADSPDCAGRLDVDVCGFDGGEACDGVAGTPRVSCANLDGRITLHASQGGPALTIDGIGAGDCTLSLEAGGDVYEGACGAGAPSTAQPCQVDARTDGEQIEGTVYCTGLRALDGTSTRDLTAVGLGSVAESSPGRFRFVGCAR